MKQPKRLALRREAMIELSNDELVDIAGGSLAACTFSQGASCAGVCSGYCPTFTCPADDTADFVLNILRTS